MERDMSYELDGVFAGRNAGELVTVRQTRTKIGRAPGLAPAARMAGGDVRNLTPALAHKMSRPHPRNISPALAHSLGIPMAHSLANPMFRRPSDLAGDITLPVIGTVSVVGLAVAAGLGLLVWRMAR